MPISVSSIEKYINFARVYVGCAVPPPGKSMFTYATNGVPSGGIDVGATQGESKFTYKPTIEGVDVEQAPVEVAPHITKEECTIEFTCLEATAARIKDALGSGAVSGTDGTSTVIRFGGITAVTGQAVALVAEQATNPGKYVGCMIYNAVNDAGLERTFKRGKETLVKFTFKGMPSTADLNRGAGEILGQYAEQT